MELPSTQTTNLVVILFAPLHSTSQLLENLVTFTLRILATLVQASRAPHQDNFLGSLLLGWAPR